MEETRDRWQEKLFWYEDKHDASGAAAESSHLQTERWTDQGNFIIYKILLKLCCFLQRNSYFKKLPVYINIITDDITSTFSYLEIKIQNYSFYLQAKFQITKNLFLSLKMLNLLV